VLLQASRSLSAITLCLKKRPNFETVYLEIIYIDFDDIWQKYSEDSIIEFACFSFYRAMHFSAKRGIAIACRLSVCPSVCDVGEL